MRLKLQMQRKNIENNTPRIAVGIIALFAIPSLYYLYQSLDYPYHNPQYYRSIKLSIDWINLKYAFLSGVLFSLEALRFTDFKAKNMVGKAGGSFVLAIIPALMGLYSLSTFESHSKWLALATFASMIGQVALYSRAVNTSLVPFWVFNLLYHAYAIDFLVIVLDYFMLRNLDQQIKIKPQLFLM